MKNLKSVSNLIFPLILFVGVVFLAITFETAFAGVCVNCLSENIENTPLEIIAPDDILTYSTNDFLSIEDLGTPIVSGSGSSFAIIANNATSLFPLGKTTIVWSVTKDGETVTDTQTVGVASAPTGIDPANKIVLIEFADGWKSVFDLGRPIFDTYGIKTTQFIICGSVENNSPHMSPEMILTMQSEGHDIQSHTMSHPNLSDLSAPERLFELGGAKECLEDFGINDVKVLSFPYDAGWDDSEVIEDVSNFYQFARSHSGDLFYLHCDYPGSTQEDCSTFDSGGNLNEEHRWSIPSINHNNLETFNSDDLQTFQDFIQAVNAATLNTNTIVNQIPIMNYHKINFNDSLEFNSPSFSTSTILLEAEMKYLKENNFTIITQSDLAYDEEQNHFVVLPITECIVPPSDDWIINSHCTLIESKIAPGSVLVQNNSVLTIPDGVTLGIDFANFNLTVFSGSGALIQSGGAIKQMELNLEDVFNSCTNEWDITGYHTPIESDYSGEFIPVVIDTVEREFREDFVDRVMVNGWGKTLAGDYLGWYSNSFHLNDNALDSEGNVLVVGIIAVDPTIIDPNTNLIIPTLPEPWNEVIFLSSDVGPSIIGKHIDVFTGEGAAAAQETFRITGSNNTVCE